MHRRPCFSSGNNVETALDRSRLPIQNRRDTRTRHLGRRNFEGRRGQGRWRVDASKLVTATGGLYSEPMLASSTQTIVIRLKRRPLSRRLAVFGIVATLFLITSLGYAIWGHIPLVHAYDAALLKLEVGDSVERVDQLMGRPEEVENVPDGSRRFVYRAYPPVFRNDERARQTGRHPLVDRI